MAIAPRNEYAPNPNVSVAASQAVFDMNFQCIIPPGRESVTVKCRRRAHGLFTVSLHKGIEAGGGREHISDMIQPPLLPDAMASTLRDARRRRGLSIAALATEAAVSPRLISEFEQGKRNNVSLETALRLLSLVGVTIRLQDAADPSTAAQARAERAARRRSSWTGSLTTLQAQVDASAPSSPAARLGAVAHASALATALQSAARSPRL